MTLEGPVYLSEDEPQMRKDLLMELPRWPLLTCFDCLAQDYFMKYYYETVNEDGETDIIHDKTFQVVRLKAFFAAVKGFITGDLDLSSRHRSRFEFLEDRFVEFTDELMSLYFLAEELGESWSIDVRGCWQMCIEYQFKDDTKWEEFKSKVCVWFVDTVKGTDIRILQVTGVGIIFTQKKSSAGFQKLCLLDLSEELLDLIFRECDIQDARALSATCQCLKKISIPYIHMCRLLGFPGPAQKHINPDHPMEEEVEMELFKKSQSEFMDKLDFLLTLPDLIIRLQKVRFFDYWMGYLHRESLAVPRAMSLVMDVLKGCQSLTTITYDGFNVDSQFVTLAHVRDLSLLLEQFGFEDIAVWNFVYFCPNVVDLSIMTCPGQVVLSRGCQQLLKALDSREWLVALHSLPHPPPLSRVKIGFAVPPYDVSVDELLVALHGFPIQDLVIDGLAEGRPDLIENIGQRLPDIHSLTLFRRQSPPPTNIRSMPLASASVDVTPPVSPISPNYEGSAADCDPYVLPSDDKLWYRWDDWSPVDTSHNMARVFSVYNPALEDVLIYLRRGAVKWHIGPDGAVGQVKFLDSPLWNPMWEEQSDRSIIVER
ncbi:uncharacterized protein EV420DRAFT_1698524 [Desarmillaria tabescens]|uniref:F-box domain-containing protein n=1 Tax=Armillaria tabescens TaxID=1929756 RepID=A0AA39NJJ1_ARMTA|nr:uncharacterized protein EV420DRAFT_1698524 [Desarmillaria tabescens]KAK0466757.1 hypothetical protein EV420DRAFT_1698524 [Desarmillaria tabescens]